MTVRVEPAKLLLFATPAHECSYLPGNDATTLFVEAIRVCNKSHFHAI